MHQGSELPHLNFGDTIWAWLSCVNYSCRCVRIPTWDGRWRKQDGAELGVNWTQAPQDLGQLLQELWMDTGHEGVPRGAGIAGLIPLT